MKDINSTEEPGGWDTRYLILKCKKFLKPFGWRIAWNARNSNKLADGAAKLTLKSNMPLLFYSSDDVNFPPSLLSYIYLNSIGSVPAL